jgi:hypothetical protein
MTNKTRTTIALLLPLFLLTACKEKPSTQETISAIAGTVGPCKELSAPDDVLFWAMAGNLVDLLTSANTLASNVGPVPVSMLGGWISGELRKLGLKDTRVVDLGKPAGVVFLNPIKFSTPLVFAVSTTGEKEVLESLKPYWKVVNEKEGIREFNRGKNKTMARSLFVQFQGQVALVSHGRQALSAGGPFLYSRLKAGAPATGISASLHLDNLKKAFSMQLDLSANMIKQQLPRHLAKRGISDSKATRWGINVVVEKFFSLLKQTRQIGLAIGMEEDKALLHLNFIPEKGSFFETFIKEQKKTNLSLDSYIPQWATTAFAGNIQWDPFKKDTLDLALEILDKVNNIKPSQEVVDLLTEYLNLMDDEVAGGFSFGAGLRLIEFVAIKDTQKANALIEKLLGLSSEFMQQQDNSTGLTTSFTGSRVLETYDNVALHGLLMKIDTSSLPPMQAEMIRKTWGGDEIQQIYAVFDDVMAIAMGPKALGDIKAAIQQKRSKASGLIKSKAFASAGGGYEKQAGGYVFLSLSCMMRLAMQGFLPLSKSEEGQKPPMKSGLFFGTTTKDGQLINTLHLPAAHLKELGEIFKAITQGS